MIVTVTFHKKFSVGQRKSISSPPVTLLRAEISRDVQGVAPDCGSMPLRSPAVATGGHFSAVRRKPRPPRHGFQMRLEAVTSDIQSFEPVIRLAEIEGMNPFLPKRRRATWGIEIGSPLEEPEDMHSLAKIFDCPFLNCFKGKVKLTRLGDPA